MPKLLTLFEWYEQSEANSRSLSLSIMLKTAALLNSSLLALCFQPQTIARLTRSKIVILNLQSA